MFGSAKPARVLAFGAVVAVVVFGLGMLAATLLRGPWWPARPSDGRHEPPAYTRAEFTALIMGKTTQEVLEVLGEPARRSQDSEAEYWHYRQRTRDPLTDRTDILVQVVFYDGRVLHVNY